ncbi:MAG: hypothetical protein E6Q53_01630 [Candidatus Moraniibacteriota bacterium]|nr:MAG: hypothetical protein E6Q53_01630 [Candidatus Moranbacteria bacterium]
MSYIVVLHGGKTSVESPKNDLFFALFTSLSKKSKIKAAMVYWARNEDEWDKVFSRDKEKILRNSKKEIAFLLPISPEELYNILPECDIVYVAGGEARNIEPLYQQLSSLKEKLDGKVYFGSSMGAFIASQSYVLSSDDKDTDTVHHGVGLVKISCLAHWDVEPNKEAKLELLKKESNLPIITLNEHEISVIVV